MSDPREDGQIREVIKENLAKHLKVVRVKDIGIRELERYWLVFPDDADDAAVFLEKFTSEKNKNASAFVDTPLLDGKEIDGIWHFGSVTTLPAQEEADDDMRGCSPDIYGSASQ